MNNIPVEEYFKYHPPKTEERIKLHDCIDQTAMAMAVAIDMCVQDESTKTMAIAALQNARMLANQGITIDELVNYSSNSTEGDKPIEQGVKEI